MSTVALSALAVLAGAVAGDPPARAETLCMGVDEFNTYMASNATYTPALTFSFDVANVNPADYPNGKGSLGQLRDTRCGLGAAEATLKLYGTSSPPNLAHPPGTLKQEYGSPCCGQPPCPEGWADPNPGPVIFADGSENCDGTIYLDAAQYGFTFNCGGTLYSGVGVNTWGIGVTEIHFLSALDAGGGTIWQMPNVVSTYSEVCFEVVDTGVLVEIVPVVEDVTAAEYLPDAVYPDVNDLAVGYQDSETYLKFVVGPINGRITRATIHLRSSADPSAAGDGGELYAVPSNAWSETTLTWNTRPATAGAPVASLSGVAPDQWYLFDASSAVTADGTYSFALVPRTTDANSAHFLSKEASTTFDPYLRIEYVVVDSDGDGVPDGPDCDDTDPAVNPGATEVCNGVDDNCDGVVDEGCGGPCTGNATEACGLDVGACVPGTRTCVGGQWGACVGGVEPVAELCDNGVDDNCDGVVDEGCEGTDAGPGGPGNIGTGCACGAAPDPGAPLVLLLAFLLGWVGRRRRRFAQHATPGLPRPTI